MKKILSIDYGGKRCGLAISDELQMIATPVGTVARNDLMGELSRLLSSEDIEGIAIGLPLGLRGEATDATKEVMDLINRLGKRFPGIEIWTEDERFTSKLAVQAMVSGNMPKSKRRDKSNIDKISATIILQSFLDRRSGENKK